MKVDDCNHHRNFLRANFSDCEVAKILKTIISQTSSSIFCLQGVAVSKVDAPFSKIHLIRLARTACSVNDAYLAHREARLCLAARTSCAALCG